MPGALVSSGNRPAPAPPKDSIHDDSLNSFGVVYVNNLARYAIKSESPVQFPRGSIIVREKLGKADDVQPQILTVMIKRARGFNPKGNDWEFLAVDGDMTKILERQKKGSCLECHAVQRERDFVFPPPPPGQ